MTRIKALIAGGLVLTILVVIGVQQFLLTKSKLETARVELRECKTSRDEMERKIEKQNAAIADLQAKAAAQAERLAVATQDAAQARRDAEVRVRRIMAEEVPQECAAAMQWGAEKAVELSKRWKM